ncbi:unnamed protein product [Prorocentrum cordatum]|uniref:Uncharacterized protein n=1 Tax=Prorocentrum cordatum TaxID=2364126 RepID=A0ABN9U3I8_9DINO|nr:unnamed protein product [Polarella glacialis]
MLRNVFSAWLRGLPSLEAGAEGAQALRQAHLERSRSFAEEHAGAPARLLELASAVGGTAFRVLQLLPPAGAGGPGAEGGAEGRGALVALLARLGWAPQAASLLEHVGAGAAPAPGPLLGEEVRAAGKGGPAALEGIFSEDPLLLKATLAASFSPLFAHGVLRCVDYQPSLAGPPQRPGEPATTAVIKAAPVLAAAHAQMLSQPSLADPGPRRCAFVPGSSGASKLEGERLKQMAAPPKDGKSQLEKVEVLKDGAYLLFEPDDQCESDADSARSQGDDPVRPPESLVAEVEEEEEAAAKEQAAKEQAAKEQEEKAAREKAAEEAKKVSDSQFEKRADEKSVEPNGSGQEQGSEAARISKTEGKAGTAEEKMIALQRETERASQDKEKEKRKDREREKDRDREKVKDKDRDRAKRSRSRGKEKAKRSRSRSRRARSRSKDKKKQRDKRSRSAKRRSRSRSRARRRGKSRSRSSASSSGDDAAEDATDDGGPAADSAEAELAKMMSDQERIQRMQERRKERKVAAEAKAEAAAKVAAAKAAEEEARGPLAIKATAEKEAVVDIESDKEEEGMEITRAADTPASGEGKGTAELLAAVARAEEKLAKSVASAKKVMSQQEGAKPEDLEAAEAEDKLVDVGESSDESQVLVRQRKKGRRKRSPSPAKEGTAVADPIEVEEVDPKVDGEAERDRSQSRDDESKATLEGTADKSKSSGDQPEGSQDQQGDSGNPTVAEIASDSDVNLSDMDLSDVEEAIARRAEKRKTKEAATATEGGEGGEPGAEGAAEEGAAAPAAGGAEGVEAAAAPEPPAARSEAEEPSAAAEAAVRPAVEGGGGAEADPTAARLRGMLMAGFLSSVLGGKVAAPRMEAPAPQEEQAELPAPSQGRAEDELCSLSVSQLQQRLRAKAVVMPPKLAAAADGDKLAASKLAALLRAAGDDGSAHADSKGPEEHPPKDAEGSAQADGKQQPAAVDGERQDGDEPAAAEAAGADDVDMDAFMSEIAGVEAEGGSSGKPAVADDVDMDAFMSEIAGVEAGGGSSGKLAAADDADMNAFMSEIAGVEAGGDPAASEPQASGGPGAAAEGPQAGAAREVSEDAFAAFMSEIDCLSEAAPDTAASALPEEGPPAAVAEDAAAAAPDQPLSLRFVPQRRAWVVACPGLQEEEKVFCLRMGAIAARRAALRHAERCEQRLKAQGTKGRPEAQQGAEEQGASPEARLLQALADNEDQSRAKISFSLSRKPQPEDKSAEAQLLQAIADEEKLKQKEQDLAERAGPKDATNGQQEHEASWSRACRTPYAGTCDSMQILQSIANGRVPPSLAKEQFEKYRPVHPFQLHWRICLHRGRPARVGGGFGAGDLLGPTGMVVSCPSRGTVARLRRQTDPVLRQNDEAELQKKMQRLHSLRDRLTTALAKPSAAKQTEVSMRRALEQTEAGIAAAQASADELIDRSWARRAERVAIFYNVEGQSCSSSQDPGEGGGPRLRGLTVLPDVDRSGALPALLLLAFLRPLSCGARGGCSALCDLDARQVWAVSVFGHAAHTARWVLPLSRRRRLGLGDLARANRLRAAISAALLRPAGAGGAAVLRECPEIARALGELVVGLGSQRRPAFEVDDRVGEADAEAGEAPAAPPGEARRRRFGDVWIDLQEDGVDWDDVRMEAPPAAEEPPEEPPAEPEEEEAQGGGFFSFDVSVEELSRRRGASEAHEEEAAEEGGGADRAAEAGEEEAPPPPAPKEPAALGFLPELTLLRELRERAERFGQMRAEAAELAELCRSDQRDGKKHARALVEAARDVEEALEMAREAWEAACAVESKEGAGQAMALATSTMRKVGALKATITDSTARLEQVRLAATQREARAKEGSADAPQLWGAAGKVLKRAREGLDERWEKIVAVRTSVEGSQRKALTRADDSIALVNERLQRWADEERILQEEEKLVQQGRHPTQRRDPAEMQAQWQKATEQDRQDAQARAEAQQQELFARQQRMLQQQWGMGESAQPSPDIIYAKPPPS